jgi:hypothetical protein
MESGAALLRRRKNSLGIKFMIFLWWIHVSVFQLWNLKNSIRTAFAEGQ